MEPLASKVREYFTAKDRAEQLRRLYDEDDSWGRMEEKERLLDDVLAAEGVAASAEVDLREMVR